MLKMGEATAMTCKQAITAMEGYRSAVEEAEKETSTNKQMGRILGVLISTVFAENEEAQGELLRVSGCVNRFDAILDHLKSFQAQHAGAALGAEVVGAMMTTSLPPDQGTRWTTYPGIGNTTLAADPFPALYTAYEYMIMSTLLIVSLAVAALIVLSSVAGAWKRRSGNDKSHVHHPCNDAKRHQKDDTNTVVISNYAHALPPSPRSTTWRSHLGSRFTHMGIMLFVLLTCAALNTIPPMLHRSSGDEPLQVCDDPPAHSAGAAPFAPNLDSHASAGASDRLPYL
jgi:hypothetical protein